MARVLIVTPRSKGFSVMYTVEKAVGTGGMNLRDDVLLVQFFLRVAIEEDKAGALARGGDRFVPPGERRISIDGRFGRQTAAYIKFFQQEQNRRGGSITADGRVDPFSSSFRGLGAGNLITMAALNFDYESRQGRGFHDDISFDQRFPAELRKSLFI